jgi:hypothetical protein
MEKGQGAASPASLGSTSLAPRNNSDVKAERRLIQALYASSHLPAGGFGPRSTCCRWPEFHSVCRLASGPYRFSGDRQSNADLAFMVLEDHALNSKSKPLICTCEENSNQEAIRPCSVLPLDTRLERERHDTRVNCGIYPTALWTARDGTALPTRLHRNNKFLPYHNSCSSSAPLDFHPTQLSVSCTNAMFRCSWSVHQGPRCHPTVGTIEGPADPPGFSPRSYDPGHRFVFARVSRSGTGHIAMKVLPKQPVQQSCGQCIPWSQPRIQEAVRFTCIHLRSHSARPADFEW